MKLWSGKLSPFSAKVRIALAEKKLDCELLDVPWSRKTLWGPNVARLDRGIGRTLRGRKSGTSRKSAHWPLDACAPMRRFAL